ncbi:MAG TPA: hypothetical protein VNJ04_10575 [Gemmatimonadaceae bacterium]|nr:hypothetical protein [Gemmatimonadaceae bacterium]
MNVTIKSGTNQVRGTAHDFLRNDRFDARDAFDYYDRSGDGKADPDALRQHQFGQTREEWPRLNPDGRYMAYVSYEGGRPDVYVRAFPSAAEPHRLSSDGGSMPEWSRDGREIVYRSGDRLMSVAVTAGTAGLTFSAPRPVATVPRQEGFSAAFEIAPDGRFLMSRTAGHDYIALILNWPEELRRLEASGVGR